MNSATETKNQKHLKTKATILQVITVAIILLLFFKLFTNDSLPGFLVDLAVFITVLVLGIFLTKSVRSEIRHRQEMEGVTNRLKELDKQKDEFISMAAHELRAPMTAIKGFISMVMQGDAGDITEKARGFLADANAINDRLVRLVNNMLNVSRIEEGRMVYQVETENLSNVVRSVYSSFRPEAERKGLEYRLNIPTAIEDKVEVDVDRIHEVVANIISNAIKYTDKGKVEVALTQKKKDRVRVEVKDTGPGISSEEQKKLFTKFHRVESNVGKTTGSGLGLYICKLLVEKFNGKIGVISEPGEGSIFWFDIPLKG